MPIHNFQCNQCNSTFERSVSWDNDFVKCPKCKSLSERVWLPTGYRELSKPIVLFRDPRSGRYEFPGNSAKPTPRGMERVEIRNSQEYKRVMRDVNKVEKASWQSQENRRFEGRKAYLQSGRADILHQLSQTSDPHARDVLREAINYLDNTDIHHSYSELRNEAMEFYSSNRERDKDGRR